MGYRGGTPFGEALPTGNRSGYQMELGEIAERGYGNYLRVGLE
jgi:hypothetical protein